MRRRLALAVTVAALSCATGTARAAAAPAEVVSAWNERAAGALSVPGCLAPANDPIHESRIYAVMHLAVHDALNAIERRSRAYAYRPVHTLPSASPDAAVAAAARDALVALIAELPGDFATACAPGIAQVEADYAAAVAAIPPGGERAAGLRVGRAAAAAILAARARDGSAEAPLVNPDFPQGTRPGEWRFTPGFAFAFLPTWGEVTPFALRNASQFRPAPPYPVDSKRYADDFNEVKRLGGETSARTPEQTEIARFWLENSPLQWNRIARTVATGSHLDAWDSARLFGLLNIALADGYIATFAAKYQYRFWRPVTAIRAADTDGNRWTSADPGWTPLAPTPPIPDHDSGHALEGGAAAQVLTRFFGTDRAKFAVCSHTLPAGAMCTDASPVLRSYTRFSQARDENAVSRILVGFHFRKAVEDGTAHGRRIGDLVADRFLTPVGAFGRCEAP
jgi:hypothetical protein